MIAMLACRERWVVSSRKSIPVRLVTVSDMEGFAASCGIFEITKQGDRFGFIINNTKAREQGTFISSSLLNLALHVL